MPYIYTNHNTGRSVESVERRLDLVGWARWVETEVGTFPTGDPAGELTAGTAGGSTDGTAGDPVDATAGTPGTPEAGTAGDPVDATARPAVDAVPFESMTVAQLDAAAASAGVTFPAGAVKAEKVALLTAATPDHDGNE